MGNKGILYGFVFAYNPHIDKWMATSRENYTQLYSGGDNVINSSDINTLVEIILKTEGKICEADQLINNYE